MTAPLTVGSLFAGIGGFDLGLERTGGFRTVWFCEQDRFCQRVLAKHWPGVPCHDDVCRLTGADLSHVDVLCGGFPCQGLSDAGLRLGLLDPRSGLWSEYARLISEIRPRYVIVENVAALLRRGMGRVLGDLAAIGYDAEWDCLRAADFGAPHLRDRVWLVAYPNPDGDGRQGRTEPDGEPIEPAIRSPLGRDLDRFRDHVSDAEGVDGVAWCGVGACRVGGASGTVGGLSGDGLVAEWPSSNPWAAGEPDVGRMAHGLSRQVDRLRSLGNALVPQIAEWIGWRILQWETEHG